MKKILPILALVLVLSFVIGCGDDDNGTTPTPVATRVVATTASTTPDVTNPMDTVWNQASPTSFGISTTNVLGGNISSLASAVDVQGLVSGDRLYLRLKWSDESYNVWRDCFVISSVTSGPPYLTFTIPDNQVPKPEEDQILVVFSDPANAKDPDVWNWRALTTDAGGVAEGMTLDEANDTLISDEQPTPLKVAYRNIEGPQFTSEPYCVHPDFFDSNDYIVYLNDKVCKDDSIWTGTDSTTWPQLTGWQVGDSIPGYFIDSLVLQSEVNRGSRWDIDASHVYSAGGFYVVMSRKLNTGSADDLNLTTLPGDSVQIQIGVFDNQADPFEGTARRGFTQKVWLVLP